MFAKLLSLNSSTSSSIEISKPKFTIGRNQRNDKALADKSIQGFLIYSDRQVNQWKIYKQTQNWKRKHSEYYQFRLDLFIALKIMKEQEVIGFKLLYALTMMNRLLNKSQQNNKILMKRQMQKLKNY